MNAYVVKIYNTVERYFDDMFVVAANLVCAREEALHRLSEEWDCPKDWIIKDIYDFIEKVNEKNKKISKTY
jgi:hypothetical protein